MLITALAYLTLRASVTLAVFLTVMLLWWAVVMARRSLALSGALLALVGMTWRAESWKASNLLAERQVSQLLLQCRQPLPKTASFDLGSDSLYVAFHQPDPALVERHWPQPVPLSFGEYPFPEKPSRDPRGGEMPSTILLIPYPCIADTRYGSEGSFSNLTIPTSNYHINRHPNTDRVLDAR